MALNISLRSFYSSWLTLLSLMSRFHGIYLFNLEPASFKVFSDPSLEELSWGRDSYFGFSVALQGNYKDGTAWLMVGAPRANSSYYQPDSIHPGGERISNRKSNITNITEPGAIFKCDIVTQSCKELSVDLEEGSQDYLSEVRSRGWLGACLDSQPVQKNSGQVTGVCAPRWKRVVSNHYMNGACYWWNSSAPNATLHRIVPLDDISDFTYIINTKDLHFYGWGQAGMSIHYPDDPTEMIIGAPGVANWKGSVIRLKDDEASASRPESEMFSQLDVINPFKTDAIDSFAFNGYSVTSGHFFDRNEILYASGGPRSSSFLGRVLIFDFPTPGKEGLIHHASRQGSQQGEGFGSSLVAADVNGDGLSDLVVGCPNYFEESDAGIGRIEILLGSKTRVLDFAGSRYGSKSPSALFGTTLATLGDLNRDNYEDIAVGAPWENGGQGAVYIYLGAEAGLRDDYAQRLSPEDLSQVLTLAGFGMGISRGIDIDENGYPDLAIGSFMSGHVTVLHSRSVASLVGVLMSNPAALPAEAESFELTACITYDGYNVPATAAIHGSISLDDGNLFPRASFSDTGMSSKNFTISHDKGVGNPSCITFTVNVEKEKLNPQRPLHLHMHHWLQEKFTNPMDHAKQDPEEERMGTKLVVGVVTDCDDDGNATCTSDAHISIAFKNYREGQKYPIGSEDSPVMLITVDNSGESLFLPNITVEVPKPFALFMPKSHSCGFPIRGSRSALVCYMKNPIQRGAKDVIEVMMDASDIDDNTSEDFTVSAKVAGDGIDLNIADNSISQTLDLMAKADLEVRGYSTGEQVFYETIGEDRINTTSKSFASFVHHYTLLKSGPTPLGRVEFVVDVPVNFTNGAGFIKLYAPETEFLNQPYQCIVEGTTLAIGKTRSGDQTNKPRNSSNDSNEDFLRRNDEDMGKENFDCSNNLLSCARFVCQIYSWPAGSASASFSVQVLIDFASIESYILPQVGAYFSSNASASILSLMEGLEFQGSRDAKGAVRTEVLPDSMAGKGVPFWVILLAILGSLLLLGLIIFCLYKYGFFRRKEREEMNAHRARIVAGNT